MAASWILDGRVSNRRGMQVKHEITLSGRSRLRGLSLKLVSLLINRVEPSDVAFMLE